MKHVPAVLRRLTPGNREPDDVRALDMRIAVVAAAQHGVVTWWQLLDCGLTRSAISRWAARGRLHRIHPAVYAVGHPGLSREGKWMAAVLASGDGAALAGRAAAAHWGISRFEVERARVLAPKRRPGLRNVDVVLASDLSVDDVVRRDSIPVLEVHRLLLDLGRDLSRWQLANVLHEAAFRQLVDRSRIGDMLESRRHVRGMATLRLALAMHDDGSAGTQSPLEDEFLQIIITSGLPLPEVNVVVPTPGGRFRVDFLWRRRRLCIETDGRAAHARKATAIDDQIRDEHLRAAGLRLERFTGSAVFGDPFAVADRLERLLRRSPRRTSSQSRKSGAR